MLIPSLKNPKFVVLGTVLLSAVVFAVYVNLLDAVGLLPRSTQYRWPTIMGVWIVMAPWPIVVCIIANRLMWRQAPRIRGTVAFVVGTSLSVIFTWFRSEPGGLVLMLMLPIALVATCVCIWPDPDRPQDGRGRGPGRLPTGELSDEKFVRYVGTLPDNRAAAVIEYYRRASELMARANVVMWIIVSVLLFTGVFIVVAGKIAQLGVVKVDHLARMEAGLDSLVGRRDDVQRMIYSILGQRERAGTSEEKQGLSVEVERLQRDLMRPLSERIGRHEEQVLQAQRLQVEQQAKVGQGGTALADVVADPWLLVAASLTRIGVLVVAIFLVQILLNLYRYNMRVAAYYLAHADALLLVDLSASKLRALHSSLWPNVGYGRTPATVMERVAGAVNDRLRRARGRPERGDGERASD